jgi:glycosyltransferase involved in cell wall biosynthesis
LQLAKRQKCLVVSDKKFEDWVLGGNSRDIWNRLPEPKKLIFVDFDSLKDKLSALFGILSFKRLIFVNQNTYYRYIELLPIFKVMQTKVHLLYTHTDGIPSRLQIQLLNATKRIVALNQLEVEYLRGIGVRQPEILCQPTGIDFNHFVPGVDRPPVHKVLLVANLKQRKNPELLLEILAEAVEFEFTLVGRGWEAWDKFARLLEFNNFTYTEFEVDKYLEIIQAHHIYLSLSTQEGGPLPLLETMACNLIPVVSDVGYSRDIINHGENGFLFPSGSTARKVRDLLIAASSNSNESRSSISDFTYTNYLEKFLFRDI